MTYLARKALGQYEKSKMDAAAASKGKRVHYVYERLTALIARIRTSLEAKDHEEVNDLCQRCQLVLWHMRLALSGDSELVGQLDQLYEYCQRQLIKVNTRKESQPLEIVEDIIEELKEGWAGGPLGEDGPSDET